ncbi:semaphorin-2A-like isoform X3 [Mytilus californianus]|uniref:semaphorin-2A-like isoform X3 n=1 Tax=Mytilus californianus TaxID=6549 RepID=UPI002245F153|nr:semaphorin-2A-like isoform X3 [Mytilus californianus]
MWNTLIAILTIFDFGVCETVYHVIGSAVTFSCHGNSGVVWKGPYDSSRIYSEANHINENLPINLSSRLFTIGNILKLVNLQLTDTGLYECFVDINTKIPVKTFNLSFPALLSSSTPSYYRYMLLDADSQNLFVGYMNHLDILDISDQPVFPIQPKSSYYFTPIQSNLDYCKLSKPEVPYCQNHIKFITKKKDDILFVCGTNADAPKGFEINTTSTVTTFGSDDKLTAVPCSNDPFHNFTAIYIKSKSSSNDDDIYYGSTLHSESTIQRPIFGTNDYMKGVISNKWMKDPQFAGSFDVDDRVFFFFRETAVDVPPNEYKVYSRVAKVCKKDIGGNSLLRNKWTSYQKTRLNCSIPGSFPVYFDIIQDVVTIDNSIFYGLFTTRTGNPASAICAFSLVEIDKVFKGSFKYQPDSNSYWQEKTTSLDPRPGQCSNDSMSLSEANLQFIADNPLMYATVQPLNGEPIFVLYQTELQHLEFHRNLTEMVFYAASNTGKIYKVFYKDDKKTYVSGIYSASLDQDVIWSMKQHEGSVYIGTDTKVQQINVINCEQYRRIDSCVKDPHCAWINKTNLLPETEFNIKCRALTYIQEHQLTNKEGVYTHINYNLSMENLYTGHPDKPKHLKVTKTTVDTIYLQWLPGNNGGYTQTFVFDYQIESSSSWTTQEYNQGVIDESFQTYQITGLVNGKVYVIKMCAKNIIGSSQHTDVISVSTASRGVDRYKILFVVAISILVLIALVFLAILCKWCFERHKRKADDNKVGANIPSKAKPSNGEAVFQTEDETINMKSNNLTQIKNYEKEEINRARQLEEILCSECITKFDKIKMCIQDHAYAKENSTTSF